MKYLALLAPLLLCLALYARFQQPELWNAFLLTVKAPDGSPDSTLGTNSAPVAEQPTASPPPSTPATSEVITANSTYINPDHVRQVEQPVQPTVKVFFPPDPLPAQANWTWTVLGRDYRNVVVTKVEADTVSIMYDGGMGRINQSDLTPELQKMMNYDPQAAALASHQKAVALAQAEAEEAPKIQALEQQAKNQADADEAQRKLNSQNTAATINAEVAQDQTQHIQRDMQDMITAHEVTIYTNPQTGAVTYGGSSYWLSKYYADQSAIAQLQHH